MATHPAVVTVRPSAPLEILQVPTQEPTGNEVKIIVQWTASTPLDQHQAGAHLLVTPPQILGDGVSGTVLAIGPDVKRYKPGDQVFGFTWRFAKEKAHQLYVVCPENLIGLVPETHSMQQAVTLGNNFVTVWHVLTNDWGFELPWKQGKPEGYVPPESEKEKWIVIWGGSSSCGMYATQVLRYYGYEKVVCVAGQRTHDVLKRYGAKQCFDYRDGDVVGRVNDYVSNVQGEVGYVLDCIGSRDGSLRPCAEIAEADGCRVSTLLPVIVKDASEGIPVYSMDVDSSADWKKGVMPIGTRTHFWMNNELLKETLQTEIMPWALETGVVEPNEQVIVEGKTLLDRAQKAMDILRDRNVSGARLVWRIAEDQELEAALAHIKR